MSCVVCNICFKLSNCSRCLYLRGNFSLQRIKIDAKSLNRIISIFILAYILNERISIHYILTAIYIKGPKIRQHRAVVPLPERQISLRKPPSEKRHPGWRQNPLGKQERRRRSIWVQLQRTMRKILSQHVSARPGWLKEKLCFCLSSCETPLCFHFSPRSGIENCLRTPYKERRRRVLISFVRHDDHHRIHHYYFFPAPMSPFSQGNHFFVFVLFSNLFFRHAINKNAKNGEQWNAGI